tara:strand:+ start:25 stop:534 length:510 start_codon:yes stop_codon:yes gene_type:complete
MEANLNGTRIKFENNNIYSLFIYTATSRSGVPSKWRKHKQTKTRGGVGNRSYYVVSIGRVQYFLHRVIYYIHNQEWDINDTSTNNQIDHYDRNKLNNNIENLRISDAVVNGSNRIGKGYSYSKKYNTFNSRIVVEGEYIHLGCFATETEANDAYINAKIIYHNINNINE